MNLWWTVRSRTGAAAMAAGVLAAAALGSASVFTQPVSDQRPAGAVYVTPTQAPTAAPTEAPAVSAEVVAPAAATPAADTPAASIGPVTTPGPKAPQQAAEPESVGAVGVDGAYTPAPPRQNAGEPPAAPNFGSSAPLGGGGTPMPGEPGYTGPVEVPQIPTR